MITFANKPTVKKPMMSISNKYCSPSTKSPRKSEAYRYVIHTVAYNEERQIDQTIQGVLQQSVLPMRWVIVSDGSTDQTDWIIKKHSRQYSWIEFARLEKKRRVCYRVSNASLAYANGMALARRLLAKTDYDFIANLDADIRLPPDYFEKVIDKTIEDPTLGITGGGAYSVLEDGTILHGGFIQPDFVGGPVQLFRKQCLEDINGYQPFDHADVVAVFMAKMKGWKVRCYPDIQALHLDQPRFSVREKIPTCFRLGKIDYSLGGIPLFVFGRSVLRMFKPPFILAGLSMLAGYSWAAIRHEKRSLPKDLIDFMRIDQKQKIKSYLHVC